MRLARLPGDCRCTPIVNGRLPGGGIASAKLPLAEASAECWLKGPVNGGT